MQHVRLISYMLHLFYFTYKYSTIRIVISIMVIIGILKELCLSINKHLVVSVAN